MEERKYQVQEAVRLIGVESHVLRYWEEELEITVERTKQGYRIYSEENIQLFQQVRDLKEQGIGLRAIRLLLRRDIEAETEEREKLMQSLGLTEPKEVQAAAGAKGEMEARRTAEKRIAEDHVSEKSVDERIPAESVLGKRTREAPISAESVLSKGTRETPISAENAEEGISAESVLNKETLEDPVPEETPESSDLVEYEIVSEKEAMTDSEWLLYKVLKRIIEEAIQDQNEKLEETLAEMIREELDLQLELVLAAMREAAADKNVQGRRGLLDRIRKWYANKKGHPF